MKKIYENIENQDIIAFDEKNNWCYIINIDLSDNHIPYFILYNNQNINKATKVATISLIQDKYIDIERDLDKWVLSKNEIKEMIDFLKQKNIFSDNKTNFESLVDSYNDFQIAHIDLNNKPYYNENSKYIIETKLPNYTGLK